MIQLLVWSGHLKGCTLRVSGRIKELRQQTRDRFPVFHSRMLSVDLFRKPAAPFTAARRPLG